MKKLFVKLTAVLLIVISVFAFVPMASAAVSQEKAESAAEKANHVLVVKSESMTVARRKTIQMTASVSNVETQPEITWSSSDTAVATVDSNGKVKGVNVGDVMIYATTVVDGETLQGEFPINVIRNSNFLRDLLEKNQILSYQYSYKDDYYYTNDKEAWQHGAGFGKIYDFAAPYILLEYDYVRVFFTYEDKDWMLQMWKGQYGLVFYGGEIGIYNREHSDKGVNEWTMYSCPDEEDWIKMEMTLYHQNLSGVYEREFTREYDDYWWCTGFKNGTLRIQEPANELRITARLTFKDTEMANLVADGLKECGFELGKSSTDTGIDGYFQDGNDIYFCWQNINDAESTMFIKVSAGLLTAVSLWPFYPIILPFISIYALCVLLVSVIM